MTDEKQTVSNDKSPDWAVRMISQKWTSERACFVTDKVSINSKLRHPHPGDPGHLTIVYSLGVGNLTQKAFPELRNLNWKY